jgi:iduronate 2-sulfatase
VSAAEPAPKTNGKLKVFIFSGQSNMMQMGKTRDMPDDFDGKPKNVAVWTGYKVIPYKPKSFGPEMGFIKAMAKAWPDQKLCVVQFAWGGSSITQWDPELEASGKRKTLYARLIEKARGVVKDAPGGVEYAGLVWMQGETDSGKKKLAEAYAENLKKFVAAVRRDIGVPDLPVVVGRVNPPERLKFREIVRKAQEEAPAHISNCTWADADGLEMRQDNTHFTSKGYLGLGRRFAAAYLKLVAKDRAAEAAAKEPHSARK